MWLVLLPQHLDVALLLIPPFSVPCHAVVFLRGAVVQFVGGLQVVLLGLFVLPGGSSSF